MPNAVDLMSWQIVHNDDIAWAEFRNEAVFHIGPEDVAIGRAVDHEGSDQARCAQSGDESGRLPMAIWHAAENPFALGAAPARAGQIRRGSCLIDEDEARRVKRGLAFPPCFPRCLDVGAFLLAGVNGFF